jgi:hypothetical protein
MFSFSSIRRVMRRGAFSRNAFALFAVFCLSAALFIGCEPDADNSNTGFVPTGEWADNFGGGYNITKSTLEYYTADSEWDGVTYPGENTKGSIKEAVDFLPDAGVLLVQITESTTTGINDKFIGVYYKGYTSSHVFLANAIDGSYALIVKNTLDEAKNTFTVDNVDTHVTYWGSGYDK